MTQHTQLDKITTSSASTTTTSGQVHNTPRTMATSTHTTTTCYFFDKIPPEVRNEIYSLAFTTAADVEDVIYFTASPPSKSIIITCKQAYQEANGLYQDAYRRFWRDSSFKVPDGLHKQSNQAIQRLRSADVAAITKVSMVFPTSRHPAKEIVLRHGNWQCLVAGHNRPPARFVVVAKDHELAARWHDNAFNMPQGVKAVFVAPDGASILQLALTDAGRTNLTKYELMAWFLFYGFDKEVRLEGLDG